MTRPPRDAIVIGGGVIGLSVADQLARDGLSVTLLERNATGREASWAGAGVLPPASWYEDHPALDALAMAASEAHAETSRRLLDETGVDDEHDRCGADYLETPENAQRLRQTFDRWLRLGVEVARADCERPAWRVPDEAQVRNPRRLRALAVACRQRGVDLVEDAAAESFRFTADGRLDAVVTPRGDYAAALFCFAAGAWTPRLTRRARSTAPGRPVRGQMLLLRPAGRPLTRVTHRPPYYAVPRRDGLVLVGATVEDVGFDHETTFTAQQELLAAAAAIHPDLAGATLLRHWSGLRPASADALPQIGPLPGVDNAWVASGHHRSGLQLAPVTARIVSAQLRGVGCDLPAEPFDPARFGPSVVVGT